MIKAKELRVGNLVLINGLITEVSLLVLKHIIEENIQFTVDGIPLTEEIILKVGYKLLNTTLHYKSFEGSPYLYFLNNGALKMSTGIEMYYLHQLQNRVFSLNGQELNTKSLI